MMKYLLVILVLVVAYAIWQHNRRANTPEKRQPAAKPQAAKPPARPHAMLTCRHCGLHMPASEAVKGVVGVYCGQEHRRLAEG